MKEQYVGFGVAKLLKEKGFNGEWHKHYWGYFHGKEFLTEGSFNPEYDYPAPTQQMAMAWLREVHNFIVLVDYDIFTDKFYCYIRKRFSDYITPTDSFNSYEEAVEAALEYVLKNLI